MSGAWVTGAVGQGCWRWKKLPQVSPLGRQNDPGLKWIECNFDNCEVQAYKYSLTKHLQKPKPMI